MDTTKLKMNTLRRSKGLTQIIKIITETWKTHFYTFTRILFSTLNQKFYLQL